MQYPNEVRAIREIRDANPTVPAKTLTRRITKGEFDRDELDCIAGEEGYYTLSSRSFLSTYSVIRRHDAKAKAAAVVAVAKVGKTVKKLAKKLADQGVLA